MYVCFYNLRGRISTKISVKGQRQCTCIYVLICWSIMAPLRDRYNSPIIIKKYK